MPSLYEASIPCYLSMLKVLDRLLDKAETHAKEAGLDVEDYAQARLYADMRPLIGQIQSASDAAKGGAARLAGVAPPSMPDDEATFADLHARIAKTVAFVETITPEQLEGPEDRIIELKLPQTTLRFTARNFLLQFSIPNFLFHVTTAYAILRMQGVPVGKLDYLSVTPEA